MKKQDFNINLYRFDTIDSTSTYARKNAATLKLPALIVADCQTNGRGRHGHGFYSPKGTGLYMTLLFEADSRFELITPAAAVCVCRILKEKTGCNPRIKWVNDIFLGSGKICGILTERFASGGKSLTAVGIGINLTTESFPDEIRNTAASLDSALPAAETAVSISEMLIEYGKKSDESIVNEYRGFLGTLGKKISFRIDNAEYCGIAEDINDRCNLTVRTESGEVCVLSSGEISIIMR